MICGVNPYNSSKFHDYSFNFCHSAYISIKTLYGGLSSRLQEQQLIDVKTI